MTAKTRCTFVLCLLLEGCSAPWSQAGASQQDFYRDNSACMAMSGGAGGAQVQAANSPVTAGYNAGQAAAASQMQGAIYEQCMLGKGWHHGGYR
jgi:hypothetical protein